MPPPFPPCGLVLPAALPSTQEPRRCAYRVACDDASRRSRSDPHRPKTLGSYAQARCTRGQRDRPRALAEFRPHDCARARGPDTHDAIHWTYSKESHSIGSGPRVLEHRWGVCYCTLTNRALLPGGRGIRRQGVESRVVPESFAKQTRRALAKPASFWVPLTEGRRR